MYSFKIYYKALFLTILLAFISFKVDALHIIGGDVVYKCISRDTVNKTVEYQIVFTMYRDSKSGGAQFDSPTNFGIYRGSPGNWTFVRTIGGIRVENVTDIDIATSNPCVIVPVNVGVQRGVYTFTVRLPIISQSYYISYQRCCRNNTILNLVNPGGTGAAFTTEITPEAQALCNNSPTFKSFPPVVICVNRPINYDHSATDVDGDSLSYSFCSPLTAGGTDGATTGGSPNSCTGVTPDPRDCTPPYLDVTFAAPNFTFDRPMGGNPVVSIDPKTGIISGSPNLLGQYVVGVCVNEYRNGVLISTLKRDFQFNVTTCEDAVNADLEPSAKAGGVNQVIIQTEHNIKSCGAFSIDFNNLSTDVRFIQNYYWEFIVDGNKQIYNTRNCSVSFPGLGSYKGILILNKDLPDLADCSDTAQITINVLPDIKADFTYTYDTCHAGPIMFLNKSVSGTGSIQKNFWKFDIEGTSNVQNPDFEFEKPGLKNVRLVAEDSNLCRDTVSKIINYFPVPSLIVIEPNTFTGCQPATIFFNNLSSPIDSTYKFEWDFGDGNKGKAISPTNTFKDIGLFTVKLKLISPLGCETTKTWPNLIKVVPSPKADFTFDPKIPSLQKNTVTFTDKSEGGTAYLWKFDTVGISVLRNPVFTFRDTGVYNIQQIVLHTSGCTDTASVIIPIKPIVSLFMPNAFTPNNDGLNDEFIPIGSFFGLRNYSFTIWNRWGDKVFDTDDIRVGWNGLRNNSGEIAPPGVYAYSIKYIDPLGDLKSLKGHCTLVR
jgi:gliding motility-associated-like protein